MTIPRRALWLVSLYPALCCAAGARPADKKPSPEAAQTQIRRPAFPCGDAPCRRGQFPPASWRPYSDASPFNRRIGPTARLIRDTACEKIPKGSTCSAEMMKRMLGDIPRRKQPANLIAPRDGIGGWPTYYGTAGDPLYSIACIEFGGGCVVEGMRAHAPPGAVVQGNDPTLQFSDRHLTVIDQTSRRVFDLWHVSVSPLPPKGGTIVTGFSGYSLLDGDGLAIGIGQGNDGRFGNLAGRVRIEELTDAIERRSYIEHALTIAVHCVGARPIYPSDPTHNGRPCSAVHLSNLNAPPMGARIRLEMGLPRIDGLEIPEWKKVFLRTLAVYGAIVNDTGSDFYFNWQTESGNQYTSMGVDDPWLAFGRKLAEQPRSDWRGDRAGYAGLWLDSDDGLEWSRQIWSKLQVVDACVSDGSC